MVWYSVVVRFRFSNCIYAVASLLPRCCLAVLPHEQVEMDEVECIVANMIHKGHIKGYISHEHLKVVLSKKNPFPRQ